MTLQDAIDFATLMIQTTSAIQRFSDGINADPGDMPGVGGPINVAVITPDQGFVWGKRRNSASKTVKLTWIVSQVFNPVIYYFSFIKRMLEEISTISLLYEIHLFSLSVKFPPEFRVSNINYFMCLSLVDFPLRLATPYSVTK
jgi:hypothetical protein